MKFGGSSVANAEKIRQVFEIVKGRLPRKPLVIASAFRGVTDELFKLGEEAVKGAAPSIEPLRKRHQDCLREMGLEASCLALEIAESVLMENVESAIAVLNQLRELGVELYMSHFGSGRLSLSSMPSFPLRGIKVDPTVVHRVGGRRADLDVVRSIMDLARSLGLRAIAEGVETVAQRERLIAFGCELGQGHLLGKPLEPKAAIALLKA